MTLILAALLVASTTVGSGTAKTDKRPLEAFTSVAMAGSFTVDVVAGDKLGVEVTADDNLLPLIITEVKGGTLSIHVKDGENIKQKTPIAVKVTAAKLESVTSSGSGAVAIADVPSTSLALTHSGSGALSWKGSCDSIAATGDGSGALTLVGKAKELTITSSGSGAAIASALEVADAKVTISGSGTAEVNATATLTATVNGSGTVVYTGNPKVTKHVAGSGTVIAKGGKKAGGGW
jgi:hypothetical protein